MKDDGIEIRIRGSVKKGDKSYLRLTEDVGGLTFVGTWIRTNLLHDYEDIEEEKKDD